jgi:hypothetical protein
MKCEQCDENEAIFAIVHLLEKPTMQPLFVCERCVMVSMLAWFYVLPIFPAHEAEKPPQDGESN